MKVFDSLIQEIRNKESVRQEHVDSLESFIKSISCKLLADEFHPSKALKNLLDKYMRRAKYPMEVAIVGQFSSGKSTFLNALLSKDVLPTGITPVTSKVNFINYGEEYKLKITFKSGATEYHGIEHLAKFTDQREAIEDIKYLSIYAPVEMLKEVSFVDTPGLNSQSKFDTETTNAILRDVDGIIWLGLIDAVAKKSELDILEKYLPNYANKSICLLNQKDRLSDKDVKTAVEYAKENYRDHFSEIIAISAREALDSRIHQKENMLFSEKKRFVKDIQDGILSADIVIDEGFFFDKLKVYNNNIRNIKDRDYAHYMDDLQGSNILDVLEFIDNRLRPKAKESKIFAIKKDFSSLCEILQNEYTRLTMVYVDLTEIIQDFSDNLGFKLREIESEISLHVELLNVKIDEDINSNVNQIHASIKPVKSYLIKEKKSLLGISYVREEYQSYRVNEPTENHISFIGSVEAVDKLINFTMDEIEQILKIFEKELLLWQIKSEKLQKNREVASDVEFYNVRYFSAQIHELIVQNFRNKFDDFKDKMKEKVNRFSFKNRFELAYEKSVRQIMQDIADMQISYEKNPESSVINSVDESEVLLIFKENLDFNYLKRELKKDDSFVKTSLYDSNNEVSLIMEESIQKIHVNFDTINKKVRLLDEIKASIDLKF